MNGVDHYGAITVPTVRVGAKFPVLNLELDGWPDDTPPLDVAQVLPLLASGQPRDAIFVMPSFRGARFSLRGVPGSRAAMSPTLFDGAADGIAMALVGARRSIGLAGRYLASDGARRRPRGQRGLAAGPTRPAGSLVQAGSGAGGLLPRRRRRHYGDTYKCQFFNGKTAEQSRQAMIAASALHFPIFAEREQGVSGARQPPDPIVPVCSTPTR